MPFFAGECFESASILVLRSFIFSVFSYPGIYLQIRCIISGRYVALNAGSVSGSVRAFSLGPRCRVLPSGPTSNKSFPLIPSCTTNRQCLNAFVEEADILIISVAKFKAETREGSWLIGAFFIGQKEER